jgi:hypothetical protein
MRSFRESVITAKKNVRTVRNFSANTSARRTLRHSRCFKPDGVKLGAPAGRVGAKWQLRGLHRNGVWL